MALSQHAPPQAYTARDYTTRDVSCSTTRCIDVMVVDDEAPSRDHHIDVLRNDGYRVHIADDGVEALTLLAEANPDVVLLDAGITGIDGLEVCRRIRAVSDVYIIMMSERATELDKVVGLAVGADDYLPKPVPPAELVARIGAMLRRPRQTVQASSLRRFGVLTIDPAARQVCFDGDDVGLTRIEFEILSTLSERPGVVFSRSDLIEQVWGPNWVGDDHLVDVHIANLRKKIDRDDLRHIKTVRGIGYRMAIPTD